VAAVVIADASPLIGLARVNGLSWLQVLFEQVLVTDLVIGELLTGTFPESESRIQAALNAGWLKVVSSAVAEPELPDLDEGTLA
jgi:predicted nucleic acid-binding protein